MNECWTRSIYPGNVSAFFFFRRDKFVLAPSKYDTSSHLFFFFLAQKRQSCWAILSQIDRSPDLQAVEHLPLSAPFFSMVSPPLGRRGLPVTLDTSVPTYVSHLYVSHLLTLAIHMPTHISHLAIEIRYSAPPNSETGPLRHDTCSMLGKAWSAETHSRSPVWCALASSVVVSPLNVTLSSPPRSPPSAVVRIMKARSAWPVVSGSSPLGQSPARFGFGFGC